MLEECLGDLRVVIDNSREDSKGYCIAQYISSYVVDQTRY